MLATTSVQLNKIGGRRIYSIALLISYPDLPQSGRPTEIRIRDYSFICNKTDFKKEFND